MSESEPKDNDRVLIIPCSGIGKAFGSVGRDAAYQVVEELRPDDSESICLSLLTMGDEASLERVRRQPSIAIDGCPKACARVNIERAGGIPAATFRVLDVFRARKDLRVNQVSDIGDSGREMARLLAGEVAVKVDELRSGEE
jgi:uncharacterized metal-binding protein